MERRPAKELLHIQGWLDRVDEILERGKDAYLADHLLQEAGDSQALAHEDCRPAIGRACSTKRYRETRGRLRASHHGLPGGHPRALRAGSSRQDSRSGSQEGPTVARLAAYMTIVLYAVLSLTIVRMAPVALGPLCARLDRKSVLFVGWSDPRGLASLVFALLALEELGADADEAVVVIGMTVFLSVIAHGVTAGHPVRQGRRGRSRARPPRARGTGPGTPTSHGRSRAAGGRRRAPLGDTWWTV